jgi:manganese-dependent inorganic pyrophosphatase
MTSCPVCRKEQPLDPTSYHVDSALDEFINSNFKGKRDRLNNKHNNNNKNSGTRLLLDLAERIREETIEKKPPCQRASYNNNNNNSNNNNYDKYKSIDQHHSSLPQQLQQLHYNQHQHVSSSVPPTVLPREGDVVLELPSYSLSGGTNQILASKLVSQNIAGMLLLLALIFFGLTLKMGYNNFHHSDYEREYQNLLLRFDNHFGQNPPENTLLHPVLSLYPDTVFIGHVNNDVDSVCSSVAAAHLFNGAPALSGPMNSETAFVLQRFEIPTPVSGTAAQFEDKDWCLVDHNSHDKIPRGVNLNRIVCVIDHHQLQEDAVTPNLPRWIQIEPIGSTTTLLFWKYVQHNIHIPKHVAGCLISGIISDTLNLTSPTTTEVDRQAAFALLPRAGITDMGGYAMDMFEAKSNVDDVTVAALIGGDFKTYTLATKRVGVAVVETVKPPSVWKRKVCELLLILSFLLTTLEHLFSLTLSHHSTGRDREGS